MKIKCNTCKGTGLYTHPSFKLGEAQECPTCKGRGFQEVLPNYEPFTAKEYVSGIHTVITTDTFGSKIPHANRVPYTEWFKK